MPAAVHPEGDNVYRLDVSGTLRKSELEKIQAAAAEEIGRVGKMRLLFVLDRFQGWERRVDWGDMRFYETFGHNIERIAIVGDEKWRDHAQMFVLADLRKSPVRYFLPGEIEQARAWLSL